MNVLRFDLYRGDSDDADMVNTDDGKWIKYSDHLAALAAQHQEDMEFTEWYASDSISMYEVNAGGFKSVQEAYQNWIENVKGK